jgi:hypothetical protein
MLAESEGLSRSLRFRVAHLSWVSAKLPPEA